MIITVIILAVIGIPLLWIIFVPVDIRVNTQTGLFEIRQVGTVTVSLHPGETPVARIRVLGVVIDKTRDDVPGESRPKKATASRPRTVKPIGAWFELMRGIIKSFHCKRLICHVDFDDVVLNAQLFPVAYFASRGPVVFSVNFEKRYLLDIWLRAYIHRMLFAFMRFYLTKK